MDIPHTEFSKNRCRICLADGDIPIFGEEASNISQDIVTFGDIQLNEEDDFPKHICDSCFKLLMGAIVFRNAAKHSDEFLKVTHPSTNESIDDDIESDILQSCCDIQSYSQRCFDTESIISVSVDSDCVSNIETNENDNERVVMIVDNRSDTEDMSILENDSSYKCSLCNIVFESQEEYHKHINTNEHILLAKKSGDTSCQICNELVSEENYEKHCQTHNTDQSELLSMLECTTCKLQFNTMENFEEHCNSKMHQNSFKKPSNSKPKVKCTVCKKLITKSYLKTHVKLHGNEEEKLQLLRQCPYCLKSFIHSYLQSHIQKIHKIEIDDKEHPTKKKDSKSAPTEFICDKCGKVFKKQHNLKLHILTHGTAFEYKCMFCPYRCIHPGLLKIHVRTHTKDYNYKCTQCPAKFLTKSNLNKHVQRHSGSKDFQCKTCEKRFYSKTDLNQHHEAVHLGLKRHICNICGKAFSYRNYMMCHQLKFHKRKKFTEGKGRLPSYLVSEINKANAVEEQMKISDIM